MNENAASKKSENLKTALLVLAMLLVLGFALAVDRMSRTAYDVHEMVGQELFPDLKDALKVKKLQITKYDTNSGTLIPFEVCQLPGQAGVWVIPSHANYPADAQEQMVKAATALLDLRVIDIATENESSHADYGVLEPKPHAVPAGESGVGTRVVLRDEKDAPLLDVLIGREVEPNSGKYYVRRSGQFPVYIVKIDTSALSTDFAQWIEKDLMKLAPWDVDQLIINQFAQDIQGNPVPFRCFGLRYADMQVPDWTLLMYIEYTPDFRPRQLPMPEGKMLDAVRLNECKDAISEMRVCGVAEKPQSLGTAMRDTGSVPVSDELNEQLEPYGFLVRNVPMPDGSVMSALFSVDGYTNVYTKSGLVYVLRFGGSAGENRRYLCIQAELNPESIPEPELTPLPENADAAAKTIIEAQNREKLAERENAVAQAQLRVNELNEKFARWFYIIPEETYRDIHLTSDDIFTEEHEDEHEHEHDEHEH